MPHGGGHVGGGGGFHGGGGHFGGGGWHHHHHHRTHFGHHHHYYGNPWFYGRGYYGYRRRPLGWGIGCLSVVGVVILLSVVLSIRFSVGGGYSSPGYAPTDTRLVSYSPTFCEGLTLASKTSHDLTTGEMYLLSETPKLNGNESFSVVKNVVLTAYGDYKYWNYYLHPGSNFTLSVCYNSNSRGHFTYFFLIKGKKNFDSWNDDAEARYSLNHFLLSSSNSCPDNKKTLIFNVVDDDEYYFVFYMESYSVDDLSVQIDFYRTKYTVPQNDAVLDKCQVNLDGSSACSIDTPLSPQHTAMLVLNTTADPIVWDDNLDIDVSCNARAWPYVAISLSVVVFVVLLITGIVVTVVCVRRYRKKKYAPLTNPSAASAASTTTATTVTATTEFDPKPAEAPPPPFNPSYGTTATTGEAPPAYTP